MVGQGFIVHPYETSGNKYMASYGPNHNRTSREFKTLKQAKTYLAKKGVKKAIYDAPGRDRTIKLSQKKPVRKPKRPICYKGIW